MRLTSEITTASPKIGQAGYFETGRSEQIVRELNLEIKAGKLLALSGIIGSGKRTMLRRTQEALA
jgi:ABC-type lipoprotein export system ATPase subunit